MALEIFTTYTEVDPNSRIAVDATRITFTALTNSEEAYVYKDFGVNHFDGDFAHYVTVFYSSHDQNQPVATGWVLANDIDDVRGLLIGNKDAFFIRAFVATGGQFRIDLNESDGGSLATDTADLSISTIYYLKLARDESVGSFGQLQCVIYSDAARTTVVDTLSLTLRTSKKDFRYLYPLSVWKSGDADAATGYFENLELFDSLNVPTVNIPPINAITDITSTTATGNGVIEDSGFSAVTAHGFVWATTVDPDTSDSSTDEGAGSLGSFSSSITSLTAGTKYFLRAYATNGQGTGYSANISFTAGNPGSLLSRRGLATVQTRLHYTGEDGIEYWIQGTQV